MPMFGKWLFLVKKKAALGRLWMVFWWRRRESNPRPQALRLWLYMLSPLLNLANSVPAGRATESDPLYGFSGYTRDQLGRDPA